MYTEGFEQWLKTANKNFSVPSADWQKANTEMWRHVMTENLEIASENLSRLSEQLKRFAHVKKPEDYLNLMKECINEDINAAVENSQKILHNTMGHVEECAKSCSTMQETTLKAGAKEKEKAK